MPGSRDSDHVLLPVGVANQALDLRVAKLRLQLHGVHRPSILVRGLWCDQLPGGTSAVRGPLAARSACGERLWKVLAANARSPAAKLQHLAGRLAVGGSRGPFEREYLLDLLPDLIRNYEAWEQRQFVPDVGLFWQTGHDDGMEFNINSRQTKDILRGAPSYRPSFNAYMWADAMAIARIADLADEPSIEKRFRDKAEALKNNVQSKLWDPERKFFFPMYRDDEEREGHQVRKGR